MGPAARLPRGRAAAGSWQWARTAETQRALLDAARAVFAEQGFADASIADVVERAGSSVGSLYHHFGGKSELFIALWQDYQQAQEAAASEAVARARKAGVTDPFELFSAGARAFMEGCWQRRDLAVLFSAGDGPPGFEVMKRRRGREWLGQNDALLRLSDTSFDRLYVTILTTLIGEGSREVAVAGQPPAGRPGDRRRDRVRPAAHDRRKLPSRLASGLSAGGLTAGVTASFDPV